MKLATLPLSCAAASLAGTIAVAQGGDPMQQLRACSQLERAERLDCLDKLSRSASPPSRPASGADNWIVSDTFSPVDYTPMVTATTHARGGPDAAPLRLSIHCRGGRTELLIGGVTLPRGGEEYTLAYSVNAGQPVQVPAGPASSGPGVAFRGDVVRLLASLPDEGEMTVRVFNRQGAVEGSFSLVGLAGVRNKVAAACKWPRH